MAHNYESNAAYEERKRRIKNKIDTQISLGICPVCNEKLVQNWNAQETHKYQECPTNQEHHRKLVDYVKDED